MTRSIILEVLSWDIQGDQTEFKSGASRSMIDELHSSDIQGYQMEVETMVLLEVSSMN